MLGTPPPGPQPDPNAYYEWRGFSTGQDDRSYGSGYVSDLNNNVYYGHPRAATQPKIYAPIPAPRDYSPFTGTPSTPQFRTPTVPSITPNGIWQQKRSFAPFKDLETARRYQQELAYKDWERNTPKAGASYGAQAPAYPTTPGMAYSPIRREDLTEEDQKRTYQIDLKNWLVSRIFGDKSNRSDPRRKTRSKGYEPGATPRGDDYRVQQKRM